MRKIRYMRKNKIEISYKLIEFDLEEILKKAFGYNDPMPTSNE